MLSAILSNLVPCTNAEDATDEAKEATLAKEAAAAPSPAKAADAATAVLEAPAKPGTLLVRPPCSVKCCSG